MLSEQEALPDGRSLGARADGIVVGRGVNNWVRD